MRGYWFDWIDRRNERGGDPGYGRKKDEPMVALFKDGRTGLPFDQLVARDELSRLTGREHLMVTISNRLAAWSASADARGPGREDVDTALSKTIWLCKYNTCAGGEAKPVGKRLFQILKTRYRGTSGDRHARWWHKTLPDYD
jgi:hypothetical protein